MTTQPHAMWLVDNLPERSNASLLNSWALNAAAELRRQHEQIKTLVAAHSGNCETIECQEEELRQHKQLIKELEAQLAEGNSSSWNASLRMDIRNLTAERDALQSRLAEQNKVIVTLAQSGDAAHKRLEEIEKQEPVAWAVFDEDGLPNHITISRDMANNHINDAYDYDGAAIEEAARWVIRAVYLHPVAAPYHPEHRLDMVAAPVLTDDALEHLMDKFDIHSSAGVSGCFGFARAIEAAVRGEV